MAAPLQAGQSGDILGLVCVRYRRIEQLADTAVTLADPTFDRDTFTAGLGKRARAVSPRAERLHAAVGLQDAGG